MELLKMKPYHKQFLNFLNFAEKYIHLGHGQLLQDLIAAYIIRDKKHSYFVEFGAMDGLKLSNSYLLEYIGWRGIAAEAIPNSYADLRRNRKCHTSSDCVYIKDGDSINFKIIDDLPELSQIDCSTSQDSHDQKGARDNYQVCSVKTVTLNTLLKNFDAPNIIGYLSIDTEGTELEILESFNFTQHKFCFISVEHNYTDKQEEIDLFLSQHGYIRLWKEYSLFDAWYIHPDLIDMDHLASSFEIPIVNSDNYRPDATNEPKAYFSKFKEMTDPSVIG